MEKIWAPWRIKYIKKVGKKGCVFCRTIKSKNDRKNYILYRGDHSFIILNIYPYNNGHLMVAPFRHKPSLRQLKKNEITDMMSLVQIAQNTLDKTIRPDGYNIGINEGKISGAGIVGHVHIHIVPRWNGDTNFMTAIANAKVIPQPLNDLYSKLKRKLK